MAVASSAKKVFDGRYEILSIVGRGACSVVYHARHVNNPAVQVALKVLLTQSDKEKATNPNTERLRKEALALVSSRHRYVVRLDDFHSVDGLCYLAMEYAPEGDLRKYLEARGGKLPLQTAERFLKQTAEALGFLHSAMMLHRDIKPENILVISDREIRLGDFGVAVLPEEHATITDLRSGVGTMDYMAPEVLEGVEYTMRSDVYALGVTYYEALSGKHPFANAPLVQQLEVRHDSRIPKLRSIAPEVPEYLEAIIMRAMAYRPEDRFASARELFDTLLSSRSASKIPTRGEERESESHRSTAPAPASTPFTPPTYAPSSLGAVGGLTEVPVAATASAPTAPTPAPATTPAAESDEEIIAAIKEFLAKASPEMESNVDPLVGDNPAPAYAPPDAASPEQKKESPATPSTPLTEPDLIPELDILDTLVDEKVEDILHDSPPELEPPVTHAVHEEDEPHTPPRRPAPQTVRANGSLVESAEDAQRRSRNRFFMTLFVALVVATLVANIERIQPRRIIQAIRDWSVPRNEVAASPIPTYMGGELTFPALPAGVYTGTIDDLIPGQSYPLSFISWPEQQLVGVFVGVEGWTPQLIELPPPNGSADGETPLRVASNGFVMIFTGKSFEGSVTGFFRNVTTGATGAWRISPVGGRKE